MGTSLKNSGKNYLTKCDKNFDVPTKTRSEAIFPRNIEILVFLQVVVILLLCNHLI